MWPFHTCVKDGEGCKAREPSLWHIISNKHKAQFKVVRSLPLARLGARQKRKGNFEQASLISSSLAGQIFSFQKHFDGLQVIILYQTAFIWLTVVSKPDVCLLEYHPMRLWGSFSHSGYSYLRNQSKDTVWIIYGATYLCVILSGFPVPRFLPAKRCWIFRFITADSKKTP